MLFKLFAGYLKATHVPIEVTDGTVLHRWNTFFSKKIKDFKEGTLEKKILKKKKRKGEKQFLDKMVFSAMHDKVSYTFIGKLVFIGENLKKIYITMTLS